MNYNNLSSWRVAEFVCKPGLNSMTFRDTNPNMLYIQNPSDKSCYLSITNVPTNDKYELVVAAHNSCTYGRPIPFSYLYIYNPTNVVITLNVYSLYEVFDISLLKNLTVSLDGDMLNTSSIIKGFAPGVSLPPGTNHLGEVSIDDDTMKPVLDNLIAIIDDNSTYFNKLTNKDVIANLTNLASVVAAIKELKPLMPQFIKTPSSYNGVHIIGQTPLTLADPSSTAAKPIKIMDRVEMISNVGNTDVELAIFYDTNGNYLKIPLIESDYISDLNVPIYSIIASGAGGSISVYGGDF